MLLKNNKMEINRNNYEIFMLDYIEGNLPLDIREDLICFLNNNPDLKDDVHALLKQFVDELDKQ